MERETKKIQENKCIKVDELTSRLTAHGGGRGCRAAGRFCPCFFPLSSNERRQCGEQGRGGKQPQHQCRVTPSSFHSLGTGRGLAGEGGGQHPPAALGAGTLLLRGERGNSQTRLPWPDRSRTSKNNRWWHRSKGRPAEMMRSDTIPGGCGSRQSPSAAVPQGRGLCHAKAPGGLPGTCGAAAASPSSQQPFPTASPQQGWGRGALLPGEAHPAGSRTGSASHFGR